MVILLPIVKKCPTHPQNRKVNAFQFALNSFPSIGKSSTSINNQFAASPVSISPITTPSISALVVLTSEIIQ